MHRKALHAPTTTGWPPPGKSDSKQRVREKEKALFYLLPSRSGLTAKFRNAFALPEGADFWQAFETKLT